MQSSLSKRQTREPQAITSPNYFQVTPPNVVLLLPRQVVAAAAAAAAAASEELESRRRSRRDFHILFLKKPGGKSQEEKPSTPPLSPSPIFFAILNLFLLVFLFCLSFFVPLHLSLFLCVSSLSLSLSSISFFSLLIT